MSGSMFESVGHIWGATIQLSIVPVSADPEELVW